MRLVVVALSLFCSMVSTMVVGHGVSVGDITITHPWAREVIVPGMNSGGYFKVQNTGKTADRLLEVRADFFELTELHETRESDGMMEMVHLANGIEIPAGATVELMPGGLHLMLIKAKRQVKEGEHLPITLVFENAGEIETYLAVQPLSGSGMKHH